MSVLYVVNKRRESIKVLGKTPFGDYLVRVYRLGRPLGRFVISPHQYRRFKNGSNIRLTTESKENAAIYGRYIR